MEAEHPLLTVSDGERARIIAALQQGLHAEDGLLYAYVFGSFAEPGPFRDIDVALCYADLSPGEADQRAFDLHGRLEPAVGFPLDLVALNGRPVSFRFHVYRGLALVVRDDAALTCDLEHTARDYFDMERRLRLATVEAFAG